MTLGGLALAVGILVDEATVEIENIHARWSTHRLDRPGGPAGQLETAVPRLLAMLCILAVFIPSFFMQGAAQASVRAAVAGRRFRHDRLVFALQHVRPRAVGLAAPASTPSLQDGRSGPARSSTDSAIATDTALAAIVRLRWAGRAGLSGRGGRLVIFGVGRQLGLEIFPRVDAGRFQLRIKAPAGTRIEKTEEIAKAALDDDQAGGRRRRRSRSRSATSA